MKGKGVSSRSVECVGSAARTQTGPGTAEGVDKMSKCDRFLGLWLVFALVQLWLLPVLADNRTFAQEITVVFRYDDPSATSDTDIENRLIATFREHQITCTWSVIPFVYAGDCTEAGAQRNIPLPEEKAKLLRAAVQDGVLEIAQHGYTHQPLGLPDTPAEFVGSGYAEQLDRLKKGKDFLEHVLGVPITIFVPPWNRYDADTTYALEQLEFECLSAAVSTTTEGSEALSYLPATCSLEQTRAAIEAARRIGDPGAIVVVLFHGYDFAKPDEKRGPWTYDEFTALLKWVVRQPDVQIKTFGELLDANVDLSKGRLLANRPFARLFPLPPYIPPFLPALLRVPIGVYWSCDSAAKVERARVILYAGTAGFYLSSAAIAAAVVLLGRRVASSGSALLARRVRYTVLAFLVVSVAYGCRNLQLDYKTAVVISTLTGAYVAMRGPTLRNGMPASTDSSSRINDRRRRLPRPASPPCVGKRDTPPDFRDGCQGRAGQNPVMTP